MVDYAEVRLWADRVRLVKRYLAAPSLWPGLQSKYGGWYQDRKGYWAGLAGNLDNTGAWVWGLDDEAAYKRFAVPAVRQAKLKVAAAGPVSGAERMRRYRERLAAARRAEEEADSFGAGGDAVCPSVFVDTVDEFRGHGDDDAFRFFGFAGHGLDLCIGANLA
jgi:hypothetical protein